MIIKFEDGTTVEVKPSCAAFAAFDTVKRLVNEKGTTVTEITILAGEREHEDPRSIMNAYGLIKASL